MKVVVKLAAFVACIALALSLVSCADLGAGESEDAFKEYFSGVYIVSRSGIEKYSLGQFNEDIELGDMSIPEVIPKGKYAYLGFKVADGYTITISEFAFFATTNLDAAELHLEFYVVNKMPTSIKDDSGNDVDLPSIDEDGNISEDTNQDDGENNDSNNDDPNNGEETGGEEEPDEEDELFSEKNKFHVSTFIVGRQWDSILLQFPEPKTIYEGQYVVVRVRNNCYLGNTGEDKLPEVPFTFNYLMFYFNSAHKE